MWEKIKNNSLLKAVLVIILGVIGFGFAFNIMFGTPPGMDSGEEMRGASANQPDWWGIAIILVLIVLAAFALIAFIKFAAKRQIQWDVEKNKGHKRKRETF